MSIKSMHTYITPYNGFWAYFASYLCRPVRYQSSGRPKLCPNQCSSDSTPDYSTIDYSYSVSKREKTSLLLNPIIN